MNKPTQKTTNHFDFSECTEYIEKKYKIDTRDYAKSHAQYYEWCNSKDYGEADREGKKRGESRIWFGEFQKEIERGQITERPYQDFWHFLINNFNIVRGGFFDLDEELIKEIDAEDWQKYILGLYLKEFGNATYLTDW